MKKLIILLALLLIFKNGFSQANNLLLEEIIEQIAEGNENELDYSELYEALYYFAENPINLNKTTKEELRDLYFLNAYQINKLLAHIDKNGKLLSYLELQTIAGFDVQTIQNLLPFISIKTKVNSKQLLANINQYIIIRNQFYLQEQKGYIPDEENQMSYGILAAVWHMRDRMHESISVGLAMADMIEHVSPLVANFSFQE
jgi:hypothetical protein